MTNEQQENIQIEEEQSYNLNLKLALFLDKLTKEEVFKKLVILMRKIEATQDSNFINFISVAERYSNGNARLNELQLATKNLFIVEFPYGYTCVEDIFNSFYYIVQLYVNTLWLIFIEANPEAKVEVDEKKSKEKLIEMVVNFILEDNFDALSSIELETN